MEETFRFFNQFTDGHVHMNHHEDDEEPGHNVVERTD